jgi:hypothetical protein
VNRQTLQPIRRRRAQPAKRGEGELYLDTAPSGARNPATRNPDADPISYSSGAVLPTLGIHHQHAAPPTALITDHPAPGGRR